MQVGNGEGFGVQQQARRGRRLFVGIEFVAKDGVADRGKVHAQLVAASGVRGEGDAGGCAVTGKHFVAGVRGFAVFMADFLARAAFPVGDERVVDVAVIVGNGAVDDGDVAFFDAARGKFLFVVAFGGFVFGDEQEAAGRHVEAVRCHCRRGVNLAAALYAVVFVVATARDGEQPGRFVDDVDVRVFVVDIEGHGVMYGYWGTGSVVFFFMGFGGGSLIWDLVIGLYLGKTNTGVIMSTSTLIIRKSGNAQIISLPKLLLEQIGAGIGDRLSARLEDGKIVLQRESPERSLEALFAGVTPEMFQTEEDVEWLEMSSVGKEVL